MGSWKECNLGDLVTFQRGHDLPKSQVVDGIYPIAGSNGVIGYHNEFTTDGPGITIGRSGNIGNAYFYESEFWAHNTTLYVREFHGSHPKFIYYLLKTLDLSGHNSGSAVPSLNRNYIHPVKVVVPEEIDEQKAIAEILSAFDDKIELNRRTNATLEAMARALFKAWFVDFEPVHANKENRPSTSASPEIAKLFPSEFENGIPKGWRLGTVADIASISKKLISPKKFPAEEFLHFSLPAFDDGMWPKKEPGASIKSNKFFIEKDSILVSKLNPHIFRAWNSYTSTNSRSIGSTEFIVYEPKRPEYWSLLAALMRSEGMIAEFQQHATGTSNSHQRVKPESTLGFGALVPDAPIAVRFDEIVRPMLRKAQRNIEEVTKLAETRDSLLPRLISGKIRVEGAEMF